MSEYLPDNIIMLFSIVSSAAVYGAVMEYGVFLYSYDANRFGFTLCIIRNFRVEAMESIRLRTHNRKYEKLATKFILSAG